MRNYLISCFIFSIFFFINSASSIENKIILKINNSIITNVDVINEANYLQALNPNLQNLKKNKILEIAKNSLTREKIKEIELTKVNSTSINSEYLESIIKSIYMNIGFKNKKEFIKHIKKFDINMQIIEKKLSNETLWNQLIYNKFFSKIKIDREKIKKNINSINKKSKSLLRELIQELEKFPVKLVKIPEIGQLTQGNLKLDDMQKINIEDLLGRDTVEPDPYLLNSCIEEKTILIDELNDFFKNKTLGIKEYDDLMQSLINLQIKLIKYKNF